ncbi:MAG TPA: alpha/beta hydrolase [Pyrinomonadaceae bacterium]|jgi:pimeloyl-ACP methyl ester carboxylesterase|nr:alpha/beta hydrolase [Pyrinomonadaceae bacterium]
MPKAVINGINMHYQYGGQGPTIVLVHGLATNLAFWYLAVFSVLRKNYRVIVYDLRGHGYSDMPPHGYTSADQAVDLDALLDHLEVERAHIVGHSFGGAVASHYAVLHPERVESLTLADARVPALQPAKPMKAWPYWKTWEKKLRELGVSISGDEMEMGLPLLEELAEMKRPRRKQRRKQVGIKKHFLPFQAWNGNKQTAEKWRLLLHTTTAREDVKAIAGLTPEALRRVNHPTLAIFGERSRWLPTCRTLQEILPDCRVNVVPGVGHFHPLLKPGVFLRSLQEFLSAQK